MSAGAAGPIRIVVVDDQEVVRTAFGAILGTPRPGPRTRPQSSMTILPVLAPVNMAFSASTDDSSPWKTSVR